MVAAPSTGKADDPRTAIDADRPVLKEVWFGHHVHTASALAKSAVASIDVRAEVERGLGLVGAAGSGDPPGTGALAIWMAAMPMPLIAPRFRPGYRRFQNSLSNT